MHDLALHPFDEARASDPLPGDRLRRLSAARMLPPQRHISLRLHLGNDSVFRGQIVSSRSQRPGDIYFTVRESREIRAAASDFHQLFDAECPDRWSEARLSSAGRRLEDDWLGYLSPEESPDLRQTLITIESDDGTVLDIPWEILATWHGFHVLSSDYGVERRIRGGDRPVDLEPPELPLRLLFFAATPQDLPALDSEAELQAFDRITADLRQRLSPKSTWAGTFDALQEELREQRPDILHLSGHGKLEGDEGTFFFEHPSGSAHAVAMRQIAELARAVGVRILFVSACQSGRSPDLDALNGMCQAAVAAGIPYALGWAGNVSDKLAVVFAAELYRSLGDSGSIHRALADARRRIQPMADRIGRPSWALPVLYTSRRSPLIWDLSTAPAPAVPEAPARLSTGLLGRRQECDRLLRAFLEDDKVAVIVTGLEGSGKTALIEAVLPELSERLGLPLVRISGDPERPITQLTLLESLTQTYREMGGDFVAEYLADESVDPARRLMTAIGLPYEVPILFFFDDVHRFEDVANPWPGGETWHPTLVVLATMFSVDDVESRFVIASPAQPFPGLPSRALHLPLGEISKGDALRLLLREPAVQERAVRHELPNYLLSYLIDLVGGLPGLLLAVREALPDFAADALESELALLCGNYIQPTELADLAPSQQKTSTRLEAIVDEYRQTVFLEGLLTALQEICDRYPKWLLCGSIFRRPAPIEAWRMLVIDEQPPETSELLQFFEEGEKLGLILVHQSSAGVPRWQAPAIVRQEFLSVGDADFWEEIHQMAALYFLLAATRDPPWLDNPHWFEDEAFLEQPPSPRQAGSEEIWADLPKSDLLELLKESFEHSCAGRDREIGPFTGHQLAHQLWKRSELDLALLVLDRALELDVSSELKDLKAQVLEAKGLRDEALEIYRDLARDEDPSRSWSARFTCAKHSFPEQPEPYYEALQELIVEARQRGDLSDEVTARQEALAAALELGDGRRALETVRDILDVRQDLRGQVGDLLPRAEEAWARGDESETVSRISELQPLLRDALLPAGARDMLSQLEGEAKRGLLLTGLETGDLEKSGLSLMQLDLGVMNAMLERDFDEARKLAHASLDLNRAVGHMEKILFALRRLAEIDYEVGRYDEAAQRLGEALRLAQRRGDREEIVELYLWIAEMRRHLQELNLAAQALERAHELLKQDGQDLGVWDVSRRLARIHLEGRSLDEARQYAETALGLSEGHGDAGRVLKDRELLAEICFLTEDPDDAVAQLEEALRFALRRGRWRDVHFARFELARQCLELGHAERSRDEFQALLQMCEQDGAGGHWLLFALKGLAEAETEQGMAEEARQRFEHCLELCTELEDEECELQVLHSLARLERQSDRLERARELLIDCRRRLEARGAFEEAAACCDELAQVEVDLQNYSMAEEYLYLALHFLGKLSKSNAGKEVAIFQRLSEVAHLRGRFRDQLQALGEAWILIEKHRLEDEKYIVFSGVAAVAYELDLRSVCLKAMALFATAARHRLGILEPLENFVALAVEWDMDTESDVILDQCAAQYFAHGARYLLIELVEHCVTALDEAESPDAH